MPSGLQVAKLGNHAHRHQEVHRLYELAYRGLAARGIANGIAGGYGVICRGPVRVSSAQGRAREAEGPHGVGDREHESRAGQFEFQMPVLRFPGWARCSVLLTGCPICPWPHNRAACLERVRVQDELRGSWRLETARMPPSE